MAVFLQLFLMLPLIGFLLTLLVPRKREPVISRLAIGTMGLHLAGVIAFCAYWLYNGYPTLDIKHQVIYKTTGFEIFIDFFFDKVTAVYAFVGALLSLMVTIFSRYYMHREEGFKRFFATLLLFYSGYNILIFAGNFETLFVGWELLGISSFLLIGFYRDRFLPVKNAMKVISIYRLSDISLLVAMWLSHHLWHENITFFKFNDANLVASQLQQHYALAVFIAVMVLIAAVIKSAQLPFSSWLPRAMEGPTSSSAIFYGSLAVHIGVFLLLRTYPFWENMLAIKVAIITIGLLTSVICTGIAKVQSSVKTQIAYSSIVQIGIIFIEVGLGFHNLALVHFAANAFLRTYQLLVSPSVLSYLIHNQFYHFVPGQQKVSNGRLKKLMNSLYILSVKEWNIDHYLYRFLWSPFKWIGKQLDFFSTNVSFVVLGAIYVSGLYVLYSQQNQPSGYTAYLPVIFSAFSLLLVLRSFAERGDARRAWILIFISQLFMLLGIVLNERFGLNELLIYLSGTIVSGAVGYACLSNIKAIDNNITLNGYHGYSYERPVLTLIFLLSCLGLLGFPITPTFIGVDLLFSHIHDEQIVLIILTSLSFLFIEISLFRIYSRIFLGQHKKPYHPIAFRSS